jgi:hypothetical protein
MRELDRNYGDKAGRLKGWSVAIASGKHLLWPGDTIIPNNLTMPRREHPDTRRAPTGWVPGSRESASVVMRSCQRLVL